MYYKSTFSIERQFIHLYFFFSKCIFTNRHKNSFHFYTFQALTNVLKRKFSHRAKSRYDFDYSLLPCFMIHFSFQQAMEGVIWRKKMFAHRPKFRFKNFKYSTFSTKEWRWKVDIFRWICHQDKNELRLIDLKEQNGRATKSVVGRRLGTIHKISILITRSYCFKFLELLVVVIKWKPLETCYASIGLHILLLPGSRFYWGYSCR